MSAGFEYICDVLENCCDKELFTLDSLITQIQQAGHQSYSPKQLKFKLLERYGSHIFFAEIKGRSNVICFRDICVHTLLAISGIVTAKQI